MVSVIISANTAYDGPRLKRGWWELVIGDNLTYDKVTVFVRKSKMHIAIPFDSDVGHSAADLDVCVLESCKSINGRRKERS